MSEISPEFFFNLKGEYIHIQFLGDDNIVFQSKKNIFRPKNGLTIDNPQPKYPVYYIQLKDFGESLLCGNIIDMIYGVLLAQDIDNVILVLDFAGVLETNDAFCEEYFKYLLKTKNKIISIGQNKQITEIFSNYIIDNIKTQYDKEESNTSEDEWD